MAIVFVLVTSVINPLKNGIMRNSGFLSESRIGRSQETYSVQTSRSSLFVMLDFYTYYICHIYTHVYYRVVFLALTFIDSFQGAQLFQSMSFHRNDCSWSQCYTGITGGNKHHRHLADYWCCSQSVLGSSIGPFSVAFTLWASCR